MMIEIERKYLVKDRSFEAEAIAIKHIEQGYLAVRPTVRIRVQDAEAYLTIKGPSDAQELMRAEYEYAIPFDEAQQMMSLVQGEIIVKDRYFVPCGRHVWEVDVFDGAYEGLILAEIELSSTDEIFALPPWIGEEVTGQTEYYNASMALNNCNRLNRSKIIRK